MAAASEWGVVRVSCLPRTPFAKGSHCDHSQNRDAIATTESERRDSRSWLGVSVEGEGLPARPSEEIVEIIIDHESACC